MNAALTVAIIALVLNLVTFWLTVSRDKWARQGDLAKHFQETLKVSERRGEATRDLYGVKSICASVVHDQGSRTSIESDFRGKFNVECKLWRMDLAEVDRLKEWFQFVFTFFPGLYFSIPENYGGVYVRHYRNEAGHWYVWPIMNTYLTNLSVVWYDFLAVIQIIELRRSQSIIGRLNGSTLTPLQLSLIQRLRQHAKHDFPILFSLLVAKWLYDCEEFDFWVPGNRLPDRLFSDKLLGRPDCLAPWRLLCTLAAFAEHRDLSMELPANVGLVANAQAFVERIFLCTW